MGQNTEIEKWYKFAEVAPLLPPVAARAAVMLMSVAAVAVIVLLLLLLLLPSLGIVAIEVKAGCTGEEAVGISEAVKVAAAA